MDLCLLFWCQGFGDVSHYVFVILVISCFGGEGWIYVLITSVSGLCLIFTLMYSYKDLSMLKVVKPRNQNVSIQESDFHRGKASRID